MRKCSAWEKAYTTLKSQLIESKPEMHQQLTNLDNLELSRQSKVFKAKFVLLLLTT